MTDRFGRRRALAGVDARVIPIVAGALRRVGAVVLAVVGPKGWIGRWVAPWIRREPVVAVALVSVAFAGVLLAVTGGDQHAAVRPPADQSGPVLPDPQRLGPAPGTSVSSYVAEAGGRMAALDSLSPSQRLEAVVDFTGYISPLAIDQLLATTPGVSVLRGYARVPPPANAGVHVLITSTESDLPAALGAAHDAASAVATHYAHLVDRSVAHPSTMLQEELQAGAAAAAAARVDAAGLGTDCGCVFALVVSGPVAQLQQLAAAAAVRLVDPAPPSVSLEALMVVPLQPQDNAKVTALEFAGD